MKILALVVAMTAGLGCQSSREPIAGTWTAQFEGRTFLRLELKTDNGTITGGMAVGNFELDGQGALRRVDESPRDLTPIFDVTQQAASVTFSRKDTTDTDRFELRMLEAGHAELHFLLTDADRKELAANGIPTLKPIPLTRR